MTNVSVLEWNRIVMSIWKKKSEEVFVSDLVCVFVFCDFVLLDGTERAEELERERGVVLDRSPQSSRYREDGNVKGVSVGISVGIVGVV